MYRVTTVDGRISDNGPYLHDDPLAAPLIGLRRPPGATVTKLFREVTTTATDWQPVAAESDRPG
jgi:hypothetical protein